MAYESLKHMERCTLCPHECGVDRLKGRVGRCRAGSNPKVALADLHFWEEPCISGQFGSGAVFFSHCNLSCVFCQNYSISQEGSGVEVSVSRLAEIFLSLQNKGAHNLNLVSPTHFIPPIVEALGLAKEKGLIIPVVYNTNAYDKVEYLKLMEGLVDIYLPDIKYFDEHRSTAYSSAPGYFDSAARAILEMYRQVGSPVYDDREIMKKGLLIRHLVLPGLSEDSKRILDWIKANLPKSIPVSLMAQYTPMYKAVNFKELNRSITCDEYDEIIEYFESIGLEDGYMQEMTSATRKYTPDFNLKGVID
jgi:putative pyruvate formate lyase activating enzyme